MTGFLEPDFKIRKMDTSLESDHLTTFMPKIQEQTFLEFKVAQAIMIYGLPFIILIGTASNIISLLVLRCKSFRTSSVSFSLSVLSAVNLGILYTVVLRQWILELTDRTVDLRATSFRCKLHITLTYFFCQLSSWTLVLIVLERTLVVCLPLAAKPYCTRKNTIIAWSIAAGVLFLLNCHFFWTFGYIPDPTHFSYYEIGPSKEPFTELPMIFRMMDGIDLKETTNATETTTILTTEILDFSNTTEKQYEKICYAHREYFNFFHKVWPWIDGLVLSVIPFVLILGGNLAIVITISKAVKFRKESASMFSQAQLNKTNSVFSDAPKSSGSNTLDRQTCSNQRWRGNRGKTTSCGSDKSNNPASSTYMLLGASFLFLLLTTPSGIYLLISDFLFDMDVSPPSIAKYRLSFCVTIFLYFLNNSINFFIYYLTGSRFRRSFKDYFSSRDVLDSEGRLSDGATKMTRVKTLV